ncbi:hypothetical protein RhiirA1_454910 [Rhizophagus irregularis]|uniref:Uncharacterized protein n=4 Tax=Rhizophagus irregularis TaxID=588596 RepID=A0A2I1EGX6_9GLOM|nr:hypothetical protein RhiirA1_454910 [Rhizophagus irregularis]PKY21382.1 hypothetical protein RhiirB3_434955 [Rhizophagus irregularis]UZO03393.1 hypothetical protein OCT59_023800 [Rhizophagus irregularis]
MSQLNIDCLNEIFKYIDDDDIVTLSSCLLVNQLWCQVSVRILWRNVSNYNTSNFNTLIACLPNESKKILNENGINISTPNSKFLTFNYSTFCKILSINQVHYKIELLLRNQQTISYRKLTKYTYLVVKEILKMFMNNIPSLKSLSYLKNLNINLNLLRYNKEKVCLKNLTELHCSSDISNKFFYQLSRICNNLLLIGIMIKCHSIPIRLAELISVQKNLKSFYMIIDCSMDDILCNIPLLMTKLPNTLMSLYLSAGTCNYSLSFITNFTNLQKLELSFNSTLYLDFEKLQYANFPQLQVLIIKFARPKFELLINFLENNGKNLKELYLDHYDNSFNLAVAKFCPNLLKLYTIFTNEELETLKMVLISCQYIESIELFCDEYLSDKKALEMIVNYSHEYLCEIVITYDYQESRLLPEELEFFFINWTSHIPQKSLSLEIIRCENDKTSLDTDHENMKIIEKYIKLGVIKKFKITDFDINNYTLSFIMSNSYNV